MNKWFLLLLFSISYQPICGKEAANESKNATTAINFNTTINIDKLNKESRGLYLTDPSIARSLAIKALSISKSIKYNKGIGQSMFNIGVSYWAQAYYPLGLFYLNTALPYIKTYNPEMLTDCYRFLGRNMLDMGNYKTALVYLNKAKIEAKGNLLNLEDVASEYSLAYVKLKQFDKAISEVNEGLKISAQLHDEACAGIFYGRLSIIYIELKNYKKALACTDTALAMAKVAHNNRLMSGVLIDKSLIYYQSAQPDFALLYAAKAEGIARGLGFIDAALKAYKVFIEIYQSKGDLKQTLKYEVKYNDLLDSLNSIDNQRNISLIQEYFSLNGELSKIDDMEKNNQQQRRYIFILSGGLVVLMVALYVVFYFYSQKRQLSKKLHVQHSETLQKSQLIEAQALHLEGINYFKDKLLAIIGHDLRSPISNLRNVIDMFSAGSLSADEVHMLVTKLKPAVIGAELTLANLLEWADSQIRGNNIQTTSVSVFKVVDEMESTLTHIIADKQLDFTNLTEKDINVMADENHLKVILRNLISNAIKYTPQKGKITVECHQHHDNVIVSVKDTSLGMTAEEIDKLLSAKTHFSKPGTQGEKGTGIGLLLCLELIRINKGKLWLQSDIGKGTIFHFSLPAVL